MIALPQTTIRTAELFCGIGGFRVAADRLGIETVWANDNSESACKVYADRFGADVLCRENLADVVQEIPDHDILTAGFPCQPFSSAGKKRGLNDPRSDALSSLLSVVERHRSGAVVLENVPFILSARDGQPFVTLVQTLDAWGYSVAWRVVNAADIGLPQFRPRIVVVACRTASPPSMHHAGDASETAMSPHAPRSHVSPPAWGYIKDGTLRCVSRRPVWRDWSGLRLRDWLDPEVPCSYDFTAETLARLPASKRVDRVIRGVEVLYNQSGGSRMGYTVYGTSGLAPTLTATTSRHYERFAVGERFRRLTPQEYARLQGFTDDHCSAARHAEQYVLFGNAIAPPMAEWALTRALGALQRGAAWAEAA